MMMMLFFVPKLFIFLSGTADKESQAGCDGCKELSNGVASLMDVMCVYMME